MTRAYIRLDPAFDERKESYPDGPYAALVGTFCLGEAQPDRGRFRSLDYLKRLLGRRGRHVQYLLDHKDIVLLKDGRIYIDGWDEWQEGDLKVAERVSVLRARRGVPDHRSPGATRTANWRLRQQVFERDSFTCRYCGQADYERDWLVADHVIPEPGGPTTLDNLVTACRPCNKLKGGRTPEEAGMPLLTVTRHGDAPRVPSHTDVTPSMKRSSGGAQQSGALTSRLSDDEARGHLDKLADVLEANGSRPRKTNGIEPITDTEQAERYRAILADESQPDWKREAAKVQLEVMGL